MFKKVLEFTMTPAGIDTAKLYPILMSSGLPREALGQIWASANRTTPGMLTKEELYTVLALIGVAQVNAGIKTNDPLRRTSLILPLSLQCHIINSILKLDGLGLVLNRPAACEVL